MVASHTSEASPTPTDDATDLVKRRRLEDGLIYKIMAWCVFPIPAGILAALSGRYLPAGGGYIAFGALVIAFDIGWDFALRATGRSAMLRDPSTRGILVGALNLWVTVAINMFVLFSFIDGNSMQRFLTALFVVAYFARDVFSPPCPHCGRRK